jgi:D-tyrosyl-tRNA(Tyr) deacylase
MRAVVQRVSSASVRVAGELVAEMGEGLLAFVGVAKGDDEARAQALARRVVHLRILPDEQGRMNRSLLDAGGTLCVVSQFTLHADVHQGRRPFFGAAAAPEIAAPLVEAVVAAARQAGVSVVTGRFGATMEISLTNVGPVTLLVDTEGNL